MIRKKAITFTVLRALSNNDFINRTVFNVNLTCPLNTQTQIVILRDIGWKELRAVVAYMYRVRLLMVRSCCVLHYNNHLMIENFKG